MIKRSVLFVSAAAILLSLLGCTANRRKALPQLLIGCGDYEPYNYTDADGEPAGLDVELATEACARIGYAPVFVQIDWNDRDSILESSKVDCLWSSFAMDGQRTRYAWVGPYMRSRQVVAVLEDSPIYELEDLTGKRVAVRAGSTAERLFLRKSEENIPQVSRVYTQSQTDEIATALRNGYVDAIAGYAATVRRVLQNENVQFRFLDQELSHASFGVAFSKDSDAKVRDSLSAALKEMLADGTTKRILERYGVDTEKALGELAYE